MSSPPPLWLPPEQYAAAMAEYQASQAAAPAPAPAPAPAHAPAPVAQSNLGPDGETLFTPSPMVAQASPAPAVQGGGDDLSGLYSRDVQQQIQQLSAANNNQGKFDLMNQLLGQGYNIDQIAGVASNALGQNVTTQDLVGLRSLFIRPDAPLGTAPQQPAGGITTLAPQQPQTQPQTPAQGPTGTGAPLTDPKLYEAVSLNANAPRFTMGGRGEYFMDGQMVDAQTWATEKAKWYPNGVPLQTFDSNASDFNMTAFLEQNPGLFSSGPAIQSNNLAGINFALPENRPPATSAPKAPAALQSQSNPFAAPQGNLLAQNTAPTQPADRDTSINNYVTQLLGSGGTREEQRAQLTAAMQQYGVSEADLARATKLDPAIVADFLGTTRAPTQPTQPRPNVFTGAVNPFLSTLASLGGDFNEELFASDTDNLRKALETAAAAGATTNANFDYLGSEFGGRTTAGPQGQAVEGLDPRAKAFADELLFGNFTGSGQEAAPGQYVSDLNPIERLRAAGFGYDDIGKILNSYGGAQTFGYQGDTQSVLDAQQAADALAEYRRLRPELQADTGSFGDFIKDAFKSPVGAAILAGLTGGLGGVGALGSGAASLVGGTLSGTGAAALGGGILGATTAGLAGQDPLKAGLISAATAGLGSAFGGDIKNIATDIFNNATSGIRDALSGFDFGGLDLNFGSAADVATGDNPFAGFEFPDDIYSDYITPTTSDVLSGIQANPDVVTQVQDAFAASGAQTPQDVASLIRDQLNNGATVVDIAEALGIAPETVVNNAALGAGGNPFAGAGSGAPVAGEPVRVDIFGHETPFEVPFLPGTISSAGPREPVRVDIKGHETPEEVPFLPGPTTATGPREPVRVDIKGHETPEEVPFLPGPREPIRVDIKGHETPEEVPPIVVPGREPVRVDIKGHETPDSPAVVTPIPSPGGLSDILPAIIAGGSVAGVTAGGAPTGNGLSNDNDLPPNAGPQPPKAGTPSIADIIKILGGIATIGGALGGASGGGGGGGGITTLPRGKGRYGLVRKAGTATGPGYRPTDYYTRDRIYPE